MFGRIFGRDKDDPDQAVCAECGRTLLAGEWTQTVTGDDGQARLICSLCGQGRSTPQDDPLAPPPASIESPRVQRQPAASSDQHGESDTFWKALKERDAEIERLQDRLSRAEAEKQELAAQLAGRSGAEPDAAATALGAAAFGAAAAATDGGLPTEPSSGPSVVPAKPLVPFVAPAPIADAWSTGDSSEPGERTWGETPAEFAAELAAVRHEAEGEPEIATETEPAPPPVATGDHTQPILAVSDEKIFASDAAGAETTPPKDDTSAQPETAEAAETTLTPEPVSTAEVAAAPTTESPPTEADLEAQAASLKLLQRGVDLLNVSPVPRKIAETNEQLGLPSVNLDFDGQTVAATFMWSMGWYRFHVDIESGDVRMDDRGYDELTDLRPNAAVRADGTVQLTPAQLTRTAAQRPQPVQAGPSETPTGAPPAEPEPPSVAAQKAPEILSKSLLGQRSDDESAASWEGTEARDFDWNR